MSPPAAQPPSLACAAAVAISGRPCASSARGTPAQAAQPSIVSGRAPCGQVRLRVWMRVRVRVRVCVREGRGGGTVVSIEAVASWPPDCRKQNHDRSRGGHA